jgi:hypothetical protein
LELNAKFNIKVNKTFTPSGQFYGFAFAVKFKPHLKNLNLNVEFKKTFVRFKGNPGREQKFSSQGPN